MTTILVTVLAGAIGAVVRYLVSRAFARPHDGFGWAVLLVNVVGSACAGMVLRLAVQASISEDLRLILVTGLCGGLTTFSTWSVETIQLAQRGKRGTAVLSVAANFVLGMAAAAVGYLVLS
ncbi:MAG: fluoride efflux transporter CrcB [Rhodoglobus sp.]